MSENRKPKKSAMLEIRLPHETKEAFMRRCRALGLSASEVVRADIDRFLARTASIEPAKEPVMRLQKYANAAFNLAARPQAALAAAALAVGVGLFATPSGAAPDLRAMFNRFDADHDGALTVQEFQAAMAGDDHIVIRTRRETREGGEGVPERRVVGPIVVPLGPDARPPGPPRGAPPSEAERRELAGREFGRMDMNGDSSVTFVEFETSHVAMMRASFVALDADQNGRISADEFEAGAPMGGDGHAARVIADLDANHDGGVSWDEFSAGPPDRP